MKLYVKQVLDEIINTLTEKQRNILIKRYGLDGGHRQGLQEIGNSISLTRERIRQILNIILQKIAGSKNKNFLNLQKEVKKIFSRYGYILLEEDINIQIRGDKHKESIEDKYTYLLLSIINVFYQNKQSNHLKEHWTSDTKITTSLVKVFEHLHKKLKKNPNKLYYRKEIEDLLVESFEKIQPKLKDHGKKYKNMWLSLSNKITMNPYGEWGSVDQPEINLKNLNSYIGLVLIHSYLLDDCVIHYLSFFLYQFEFHFGLIFYFCFPKEYILLFLVLYHVYNYLISNHIILVQLLQIYQI